MTSNTPPVMQGQQSIWEPNIDVFQDPVRTGRRSIFEPSDEILPDQLKEEQGLKWWAHLGGRALRGVADASIKGINSSTQGFDLLRDYFNYYVRDISPSEPASGAVDAMTGRRDSDVIDVIEALGGGTGDPRTMDADQEIRRIQSEALGRWEIAGAITGELIGSTMTGTPIGAMSSMAARGGAAMAEPIRRAVASLISKGKMTAFEAAKAMDEGRLLYEASKAAGWGSTAQKLSQFGDKIPGLAGEYASIVTQNFALNPNHDEEAGKLHAWLMPGAFVGIGRLSRAAGEKLMSVSLTRAQKESLVALEDVLKAGGKMSLPMTERVKMALQTLPGHTIATVGESMGFMSLDPENWKLAMEAYGGDAKSQDELLARFAGTTAGVAAMKLGIPLDEVRYIRRIRPELNTIRLDLEAQRRKAVLEDRAAAQEPRDIGARRAAEMAEGAIADQQQGEERMRQFEAGQRALEGLISSADQLRRSGWSYDTQASRPLDEAPTVVMQGPGGDAVRIRSNTDGSNRIEVDPKTYRAVTGLDVSDPAVLTGKAADDFMLDLGLRQVAQRLRVEMRAERMGLKEMRAGEEWVDQTTGNFIQVGLDGKLYERSPLDPSWRQVKDDSLLAMSFDTPMQGGAISGTPAYVSPQMEAWGRFIEQKSRGAPEPVVDEVLSLAFSVAMYGGKTRSAEQMRAFFDGVSPDVFVQSFTPQTQRLMAHQLGAIGSGLQNAMDAAQVMFRPSPEGAPQNASEFTGKAEEQRLLPEFAGDTAFGTDIAGQRTLRDLFGLEPRSKPAEKSVEAKPVEQQQAPAETQQKVTTPEEIAGRKDWRQARLTPEGRVESRKAAQEYLLAKPDATDTDVSKLFGVDRSTVRKLRKSERGEVAIPEALQKIGEKLSEVASAFGRFGPRYTKLLPDLVATSGGETGKKLGRDLRETFDIRRNLMGDLNQTYETAISKTGKHGEELEKLVPMGKVGDAEFESYAFTEAMHDRVQVSSEAAPAVAQAQALIKGLHDQAREAGALRRNAKGDYEPYTESTGHILPRQQLGGVAEIASNPKHREALRQALRDKNNLTDESLNTLFDSMMRLARGEKDVDREAATEIARELRWFPDRMKIDGKTYEFFEGRPREALERAFENQTARTAIIKGPIGADLPADVREKFGITKVGATARLNEYAESGADSEAVLEARAALLRASGQATSGDFPKWIETLLPLDGVRRAVATFYAPIQDIPDVLVSGSSAGFTRLFKTLLKNGIPGTRAYAAAAQEAKRMGSVLPEAVEHMVAAKKGSVRQGLTAHARGTERWKQVVLDSIAKSMVKDMEAGQAGDLVKLNLYRTRFTAEEMEKMLSGNGGDLYRTFRQRFTSTKSGNFIPGEGSYLHQSRAFNVVVPFQRFFMNRLRELSESIVDMKMGPEGTRVKAGHNFVRLAFGAVVSGVFSDMLLQAAKGKSPEQWAREFGQYLGWNILTAGGAQLIGGVPATVARNVANEGTGVDVVTQAISTLRWFTEPFNWATSASGTAYQGKNPLGAGLPTFIERMPLVPLAQTAKSLLAAFGVKDAETQSLKSTYGAWARAEGLPKPSYAAPEDTDEWITKQELQKALAASWSDNKDPTQDPAVQEKLKKALGVLTGDEIAQSLLGMRLLDQIGGDAKKMESLRAFAGDDQFARMLSYDNMLAVAAKGFRKEAGTKDEALPFDREMEVAKTQAVLGRADAFRQITDEVLDRAAVSMASGVHPGDEWRKLAATASQFPEAWTGMVSDEQLAVLKRAANKQGALTRFLWENLKRRADAKRSKAKKDAKDARKRGGSGG